MSQRCKRPVERRGSPADSRQADAFFFVDGARETGLFSDCGIFRQAGAWTYEDPKAVNQLRQAITSGRIDQLLRNWLPHPFTAEDRQACIQYDISILQAEFSLIPIFEHPRAGACVL